MGKVITRVNLEAKRLEEGNLGSAYDLEEGGPSIEQ